MTEPTVEELVRRVREGLLHERPSISAGSDALSALQARVEQAERELAEADALNARLNVRLDAALGRAAELGSWLGEIEEAAERAPVAVPMRKLRDMLNDVLADTPKEGTP